MATFGALVTVYLFLVSESKTAELKYAAAISWGFFVVTLLLPEPKNKTPR